MLRGVSTRYGISTVYTLQAISSVGSRRKDHCGNGNRGTKPLRQTNSHGFMLGAVTPKLPPKLAQRGTLSRYVV